MEFKGTKGEWKAIREDDGYAVVKVESGWSFGRVYIAEGIRQGYDEGKYDALLMAHAPKMLQKLTSVFYMSEEKGVEGCTYGDSEMSSVDVAFGYNLALEHIKQDLEKLLKIATGVNLTE